MTASRILSRVVSRKSENLILGQFSGTPSEYFFIDLLAPGQQNGRMGHTEIRKKMLEMRFTDKQIIIAERLLAGDTPAEICEKMGMKRPAVNSLINACYAKADVKSRPKFTALFLLASDF